MCSFFIHDPILKGNTSICTPIYWLPNGLAKIRKGMLRLKTHRPPYDKTNKMACAPSEGSDQPGHPPSLIRVRFPHEESLGPYYPLSAQRRL